MKKTFFAIIIIIFGTVIPFGSPLYLFLIKVKPKWYIIIKQTINKHVKYVRKN
jgi:hypothetical protein